MMAKLSGLPVAQIQELATMLYADKRDEADVAFDVVIDALSSCMPEDKFVQFCDRLAA